MCPKGRPKVYCPPNSFQNPLPNPSILAVIFDPPANFVENVDLKKIVFFLRKNIDFSGFEPQKTIPNLLKSIKNR